MIVTSQAGFSNGSISSALWFLALVTRVATGWRFLAVRLLRVDPGRLDFVGQDYRHTIVNVCGRTFYGARQD